LIINNSASTNRGVNYILSGGKSCQENILLFKFGKIFNFFKKEFHFHFEISLKIKKTSIPEEKKC